MMLTPEQFAAYMVAVVEMVNVEGPDAIQWQMIKEKVALLTLAVPADKKRCNCNHS